MPQIVRCVCEPDCCQEGEKPVDNHSPENTILLTVHLQAVCRVITPTHSVGRDAGQRP